MKLSDQTVSHLLRAHISAASNLTPNCVSRPRASIWRELAILAAAAVFVVWGMK